ncbi:hypothetical protein COV11_03440 [Candidatus Woesearchaeota archaeon CG10_big_fil_rev_8_21_14_0_10_30_7]|nr:MAG: hypothetical protein COV11_03440 [Candidatus Woesearchaeota archaeon CG10_big_fil_rev_8_21_14_0_10_30_7]
MGLSLKFVVFLLLLFVPLVYAQVLDDNCPIKISNSENVCCSRNGVYEISDFSDCNNPVEESLCEPVCCKKENSLMITSLGSCSDIDGVSNPKEYCQLTCCQGNDGVFRKVKGADCEGEIVPKENCGKVCCEHGGIFEPLSKTECDHLVSVEGGKGDVGLPENLCSQNHVNLEPSYSETYPGLNVFVCCRINYVQSFDPLANPFQYLSLEDCKAHSSQAPNVKSTSIAPLSFCKTRSFEKLGCNFTPSQVNSNEPDKPIYVEPGTSLKYNFKDGNFACYFCDYHNDVSVLSEIFCEDAFDAQEFNSVNTGNKLTGSFVKTSIFDIISDFFAYLFN